MTDQRFPVQWQRAAPNDNALNQTEIRVIGMSRSGNHAILQWLMHQLQGRTAFLNCVEPKTNPYASARPLGDGRRAVANYPQFDLDAERRGRLTAKDTLIYSYEDVFLGAVTAPEFERGRPGWLGTSRRRIDVLILRDPFNLFASRRRGGFYRGSGREPADTVTERTALRIWKQHAREALRERPHLHAERILIRYNDWVAHRETRRALAQRLGLRFDDAAARRVPDTAGGSSFDGTRADGHAGDMAVTERWHHFAHQASFRNLFDGETHTLARRLFGNVAECLHAGWGETA